MVDVLYTEDCIILSLNDGPLSVSYSNKNVNIILVYKQKGDRAECGNSHGISLLSAAGKVLGKIMLTVSLSTLWISSCLNLDAGSGMNTTQLT